MKKILLVEDNETIVMGLKYSLEQENFQVISAKSVAESKEKIKQEQIDIVLLDVSLPDGNGFDICKEIKEKQDIPVIFLTAQDEETSVVLGLDLGADDYIVKPFRTRELISRIKSVLRRYGQKEENTLFTKITIRDEGEGMTKEDLKHIFERFYKGQNSSENSVGIGLALAKNIIEKNNGMISCKSELDKGTEFVIKYMK